MFLLNRYFTLPCNILLTVPYMPSAARTLLQSSPISLLPARHTHASITVIIIKRMMLPPSCNRPQTSSDRSLSQRHL